MRDAGWRAGGPPVLAALFLVASIACAGDPPNGSLTAVSWGGSFARAVNKAYYEPFEARTGVVIGREDYNGGLAQIRTQVDIGNVHWDVLSLEIFDAIRGCDEGLLERIPRDILLPGADGSPPSADFWPGTSTAREQGIPAFERRSIPAEPLRSAFRFGRNTPGIPPESRLVSRAPHRSRCSGCPVHGLFTECGVGHTFYSTIYAYHPDRFPGEKPATIADFFDLERFPGRRGMRRSPLVNLEVALLADRVPPDGVYAALDTPEGLQRAFRKLETIRDHVVWWEAGAQPPQMLADAEVVMSTAYNGRIFNAQVLENQPFVIVWDGQVLDGGQMAIVAGSPNLKTALEYIRFITSPESLARLTGYIAYSPVRRSALPLVSTHVETGTDMRPHLPTSPENVRGALRSDVEWWTEHLDEMNERFSAWLAKS